MKLVRNGVAPRAIADIIWLLVVDLLGAATEAAALSMMAARGEPAGR